MTSNATLPSLATDSPWALECGLAKQDLADGLQLRVDFLPLTSTWRCLPLSHFLVRQGFLTNSPFGLGRFRPTISIARLRVAVC